MQNFYYSFFIIIFFILTCFSFSKAEAQTISIVRDIDFGLVLDRGGPRSRVFANSDGTFSANRGIEFITNPSPAEVQISGAIGFSSYTVDVVERPRRFDVTGPGVTARVNNFNYSSPDAFTIDFAGMSTFFVGARLNTRRVAEAPYPEATFNGNFSIEVTFFP